MAFGPIQILALGFPDISRFEGRAIEALAEAADSGVIRVVDVLAVIRQDDETDILRASQLDDEQREELGAGIGALIGLGYEGGIDGFVAGAEAGAEAADAGGFGLVDAVGQELVETLPVGSAGVLLIIEHRWAIPLRDAILDVGGIMLANRWLGMQDLVAIGVALREDSEV